VTAVLHISPGSRPSRQGDLDLAVPQECDLQREWHPVCVFFIIARERITCIVQSDLRGRSEDVPSGSGKAFRVVPGHGHLAAALASPTRLLFQVGSGCRRVGRGLDLA